MLKVSNFNAGYEGIRVIWDVSLRVEEGEVVSVLGPNGAGKTTLLNGICGVRRPFSGSCTFLGEEIFGYPSHKIVKKGISFVPEGGRIFPLLTVRENLDLGALKVSEPKQKEQTAQEVYELFSVLRERAKQAGGTLSGGEQQMLAIGRALMSRPKLLLLDEPSSGLAPSLVASVFQTLEKINKKGTSILLVEQNIAYSLRLSDRGYILANGRIKMESASKDFLNNEEVKKHFLGL